MALPSFLQFTKKAVKEGGAAVAQPAVAQPADDSEGAQPAQRQGFRALVPAVVSGYAADQNARAMPRPVSVEPSAVPVQPVPAADYVEPVSQPAGPAVSRADANASIRESGIRPDAKLFRSGDREADLEDRRQALEDYEPEKRGWWQNFKAVLPRAAVAGLSGGLPGLVGAAGAAAVGAAADPTVADKQWRRRELAKTDAGLAREYAVDDAAARRQRLAAQTAKDYSEARAAAMKPAADALKAEQEQILGVWKDLDTFDPEGADPQTAQLMERARRARVTLPKKQRGESYSTAVAPDGSIIVTNTRTGAYKVDRSQNVAKPREIKPDDLPDTLFGLPDEKAIADEARAAVAPDLKSRRVTDYAARHYVNDQGQFDEAKAWEDIEAGVVKPSEVWENVTSQDDQRLAGARSKVRQKYASLRAEADKFRLALSRARPKEGAPAKSVGDLVGLFNEYGAIKDAKRRRQMLDALYKSLDYVNVQ